MLLIITSTGNELFTTINIYDLERPWTPKIKVFSNFVRLRVATHILRVNWTEMDRDRPRYLTLPYLTSRVDRLLHLPSAEAVSARPNARLRM